ncbi:hypothetical protein ADK36_10920, partial [Streptomyces viridochromogenes]
DYTQEDLFAQVAGESAEHSVEDGEEEPAEEQRVAGPVERRWVAGHDVRHVEYGHGWGQGSGVGRVTVRFETPESEPGRVRTFRVDDPGLEAVEPLPLVRVRSAGSGGCGGSGDPTGGARVLWVGVRGGGDYTQEDLFAQVAGESAEHSVEDGEEEPAEEQRV